MLNSLPRNYKLSRSEESGYDSDMTKNVDTKSPKNYETSEGFDYNEFSGYNFDTEQEKYAKGLKNTCAKQRSKSIAPDKPPRKSRELLCNTSPSKPVVRSNSQPSAFGRMYFSDKQTEKMEVSSYKVCEYSYDIVGMDHSSFYR